MRHQLFFAMALVAVTACTEKQPESGRASASSDHAYNKATATRPTSAAPLVVPYESCNFDSVNDGPRTQPMTVADKARIKLSGWAGNIDAGTSSPEIFIELDGPTKIYVKASRGIKRPDVVAKFKKPGLNDSGWESYADLSDAPAGLYRARIVQVDGQSALTCENGTIQIN